MEHFIPEILSMTKSMVSVAIIKNCVVPAALMRIGFGEFLYSQTSEWKGERYKGQWVNDKKNGKKQNLLLTLEAWGCTLGRTVTSMMGILRITLERAEGF
jgi:hypothetical protein